MEVMLTDMGVNASCVSEGACEVETARNLGVDWVVSGSVLSTSGQLLVSLKLHETRTGSLLGTKRVVSVDALSLLEPLEGASGELLAAVVGSGGGGRPASAGVARGGMVSIAPGTFTMGSPSNEAGRDDDEVAHTVTLTRGFLMMAHEVTQGEFESVMGFNPSATGRRFWDGKDQGACSIYEGVSLVDGSYPVMCVSWLDAVEYANALSRREGLPEAYRVESGVASRVAGSTGYRLPTEAEWEWAARGGRMTPWGGEGSSEAGVCGLGNIADASAKSRFSGWTVSGCDDGAAGLARVGSYAANGYGLYDMVGNVWEWTEDGYGAYASGAVTDPVGSGSLRVYRGGSWNGVSRNARVAGRSGYSPDYRLNYLGFRLVRSAP
jgi:formylglycine-generating enzyme required for sulfatase activity